MGQLDEAIAGQSRFPREMPRSAEPRTIGAWIGHKAEANGDRLALTVEGRDKSYAGVHEDSDRLGAGLAALGLGRVTGPV